MLIRTLLATVVAGLVVGVVMTPIQYLKVVPLIVHAETYESGSGGHDHQQAAGLVSSAHAATDAALSGATLDTAPDRESENIRLAHSGHDHGEAADGGEGGDASLFESRILGTLLADIVTGGGFALMLSAVALLVGRRITTANGALWGLAGFAAVALAPALGLPPELPAMPVADLSARQGWWILTVGLTAIGLYLLILRREPMLRAGGIALLVVPHLFTAPHPADLSSPIPPTLAAEFAVASLATGAVFWVLLGLAIGAAMDRFVPDRA